MNRENILYVRSTCSMYPGTRVVKERNVRVTRVTVTLPGSEITRERLNMYLYSNLYSNKLISEYIYYMYVQVSIN